MGPTPRRSIHAPWMASVGQAPKLKPTKPNHDLPEQLVDPPTVHGWWFMDHHCVTVQNGQVEGPNVGVPFMCNVSWVGRPNVGGPLKYNNEM
uniref:Uncharacterized protein n=1 Tax=Solanum tuberosum TaxID=4113 RepID=M1DJE7_SOLTU